MKQCILLCFLALTFSITWAQNTFTMPNEADITVELLQTKIKKIEESTLSDEDKKKATESLNSSIQQIRTRENWSQKEKEFAELFRTAPEREKTIKERIANMEQELKLPALENLPMADVEKMLTQIVTDVDVSKKELTSIQNEAKQRSDRRLEIPKLLVELKKRIESLPFVSTTDTAEIPPLTIVSNILSITTKKALEQEYLCYEREISSYDARNALIGLRQENLVKRIDILQRNTQTLRAEVAQRKKIEAEKAAKEALEALRGTIRTNPIIQPLIQENAIFAEERKKILEEIDKVTAQYVEIEKQLAKVQEDFTGMKEKETAAQLTNLMGILLRQKLNNLPEIHQNLKRIEKRQYELPSTQLKILNWEDQRVEILNLDKSKKELVEKLPVQDPNFIEYVRILDEALNTRKDLLEKLLKDYNTYFTKLIDLDTRENLYVNKVKEFRAYIEERIFWVKSSNAIQKRDFSESFTGMGWLLDTTNWKNVFSWLLSDASGNMLLYSISLFLFSLFVAVRWRIYRNLDDITKLVSRKRTDSFRHTITVLFFTLVIAFVTPTIMWFLSWRLETASEFFVLHVSIALHNTAFVCLILNLSYAMCMRNGLGEAHFLWNKDLTAFLRVNLRWFITVSVPIYFSLFILDENGQWHDTLGRVFFILGMVAWSAFFYLFIREYDKNVNAKIANYAIITKLCYLLSVIVPLGFISISAVGFHYTAIRLSIKIVSTITIFLIVFFIASLILRWIQIMYNRLEYIQSRRISNIKIPEDIIIPSDYENTSSENKIKNETEQKIEDTNGEQNNSPAISKPEVKKETSRIKKLEIKEQVKKETSRIQKLQMKEQTIASTSAEYNFKELMEQTRYSVKIMQWIILFFFFWSIWRDTLPAWKIFNRIQLWSYHTTQGIQFVSLSDLIYFVLIMGVAFVVSKNLPKILEVVILQRFKLDKGINFAISTLTRYIVISLGIILAFPMLGFSWSQVQWLVAAFSVGLGFGLQEIFANFVSGLIILFERPLRVGDIVTIGTTTGTVTQIKIRATTITDWDRKELIVPNKEFITKHLVNWSLSDTILRIVIPVGVAYGSDTQKTYDTLIKVAKEHPNVLNEPAPSVIFNKFDNSSLSFNLRVFIPNIDFFIKVTHELHFAIDQAFRKEGVTIAFPQQDIHIRSINSELEGVFPIQQTTKPRGRKPGSKTNEKKS